MTPTTMWTAAGGNELPALWEWIYLDEDGIYPFQVRGKIPFPGYVAYAVELCISGLWMISDCSGERGGCITSTMTQRPGNNIIFRNSEVMHFKTWYSLDGFMGMPVKDILKTTVGGAGESQEYMNNLYKQGANSQYGYAVSGRF